jgi:hypothetical protein
VVNQDINKNLDLGEAFQFGGLFHFIKS